MSDFPEIASIWRHTNGALYIVTAHSNMPTNKGYDPARADRYPPFIHYMSANGNTYGRRASDWDRSFTRMHVDALTRAEIAQLCRVAEATLMTTVYALSHLKRMHR